MTSKPTLPEQVRVFSAQQGLFSPGDRVLVAFSGGADSMALLTALLELRGEWPLDTVAAAHIHHGLRGAAADRDEQTVREFCRAHGVPLFVHHADVAALAAEHHRGIEETGREVRYAFLKQVAAKENMTRIATAHTATDCVETVLWHMVRGTGPEGLAGIPAKRGALVRPLLLCTRADVEAYCRLRELPFVQDETNTDITYTRNRLRQCVLPQLRELNPQLEAAVGRLSRLAADDTAYWQAQTDAVLRESGGNGVYLADKVYALPAALRRRVLRELLLRETGQIPSFEQVLQAESIENGGSFSFGKSHTVRVKQGWLTVKANDYTAKFEPQPLQPGTVYAIGGDLYRATVVERAIFEKNQKIYKIDLQCVCDYDKLCGSAWVRTRQSGDALTPFRRGGHKSLKKWMIDERVPQPMRDRVPLVVDECGVALAVGLGCDERVAIDADTAHILMMESI